MSDESKVLIVGLGSIGHRHLKLLAEMWQPEVVRLTTEKASLTSSIAESPLPINNVFNWEDALAAKPEFAIVANPTAHHVEAARHLANSGVPFIIEKPVSDKLDGLDELISTVRAKKLPVLVGFQLRHHPGYLKFIDFIQSGTIGKPVSLQGHVGHYLPEWRPEVDYRHNYSASKKLGGGVIFDLSHEIDVAISTMGKVIAVHCVCGHYSDLEIDSEDIAEIVLEHENNRISHLHLNYLEPKYRWSTVVLGTAGSITWDYGSGYVSLVLRGGRREMWHDPAGFERDDMFRKQMQQWLEVMDGNSTPSVTLDAGIEVTKVAVAAHRSAWENKKIQLP